MGMLWSSVGAGSASTVKKNTSSKIPGVPSIKDTSKGAPTTKEHMMEKRPLKKKGY